MSLRRPTGTLQMVNLDKWINDDLQVPLKIQSAQVSIPRPTRTFTYSIWSNEYTKTYSYFQILNLVKWVYHDLLVPSNTQSGQMSIRWATGSLNHPIWTMSMRPPTETHAKVNLVKWVGKCDWLMCRYIYMITAPRISQSATCICVFLFSYKYVMVCV